ncbi:ATP-binding protein [Acidisphaera sp. L21]|uniref:ATP-binding protein n=1 Tax=Acidisphaera sp. L21 TaxID=1641851 RepID=UPI00131E73B0|nr:ATP-binding protein [Acidisphaera sp. L21]
MRMRVRTGLKRVLPLPRSLLGRSLLIILLPLVLLQAVAFTVFYGSYLDVTSRRLAFAIAGEVSQAIELMHRFPGKENRDWILFSALHRLEVPMTFAPGEQIAARPWINQLGPMDDDLAAALEDKVHRPYTMDWTSDPRNVDIHVQLPDGVLKVQAPRKRLYTSTLYLFVLWLAGSALLLFSIAALFMRNQVRAIRRLAGAAEAFGMGRDRGAIKLEGASEVRQAAAAFNRMQARISRFLTQRTEMLAGVSHDLRTPLTRLRLALAMLPPTPGLKQDVADMTGDVEEMDRMIGAYLSFARGEGLEQARPVDLSAMLRDVAAGARRAGADVTLNAPNGLEVLLRPDALRRAMTNLVDNARRHARRIALSAQPNERNVEVLVDDDGPGIPPDRRESVFRPFETGGGGTGLGLTIARDIVRAHGGDILLESSAMGGLRARIRLPL